MSTAAASNGDRAPGWKPRFPGTFRGRMIAIVFAVAIVPLVLLGAWLAGATARSGEALLRARLNDGVREAANQLGASWTRRRSELQDLADNDAIRASVLAGDTAVPPLIRDWLARSPGVRRVTLRSLDGGARWALRGAAGGSGIAVAVPVHADRFGPQLGALEAVISPESMLGAATPAVAGIVLAAFEAGTGAPLSALPFDPLLLLEPRFVLGDEEWLTIRRTLAEPYVELVAAAALTPYLEPFREPARSGLMVLGAVAAGALVLVLLMTGRQTRSLERLAAAADAVRRGDLQRRVDERGTDEIRRVAGAFNSMTVSLQQTMAELADRRALAAVGEFAASLAHEIRNPLTSIQVDLQLVEERIPAHDEVGREVQARALTEIRRLDATLAGALRTARSGRMTGSEVDLAGVLHAAMDACRSALENGRTIELRADANVRVHGDRGALIQVMLNLMLNAAQAIGAGGRIVASCSADDDVATITIEDDGPGIPASVLPHVFEPLFTTRPDGTGLGLVVARQLVRAHNGDIVLDSEPGRGTRVRVTLPNASLQRASTS